MLPSKGTPDLYKTAELVLPFLLSRENSNDNKRCAVFAFEQRQAGRVNRRATTRPTETSIHMLLDRLGAHAGADASVIGKTLTVTGSATVEEGLCQLLCDNARQREWRFATETLAACILASGRQ